MTFEHVGPALLLAALAAAAARGLRRDIVIAVSVAAGLLALVPLGGPSIAGYMLALPGTLSAAMLVLSAQLLLRAAKAPIPAQPSNMFLACLVICGLVLYAPAAGLVIVDGYDLGFRGLAVPLLMAVFVVAGWLARSGDVAVWIAVSALLYVTGAHSSANLWDYLVDPTAFIVACAALIVRAVPARAQRRVNVENSDTTRS